MPSGKLLKFKCKEAVCGAIVRSDKWSNHCKKKHPLKFNRGLEIKHAIIEERDEVDKTWKKFVPKNENDRNAHLPSTSTSHLDLGMVAPVKIDNVNEVNEIEVEKHTSDDASISILDVDLDKINQDEVSNTINQGTDIEETQMDVDSVSNIAANENEAKVIDSSEGNLDDNSAQEKEDIDDIVRNEGDRDALSNIDSDGQNEICVTESMVDVKNDFEYDISHYSSRKLTAQIINILLKNKDNYDKNFDQKFPNAVWKHRCLPDGGKEQRKWLVYSQKKNSIFCFTCAIFGSPGELRTINDRKFSLDGYGNTSTDHDWQKMNKNVSRDVENHESQSYHRSSELTYIQWLSPSNLNRYRIDNRLIEQNNYWVKHYRAVLSVVIDCCRYLSSEMMALRNSDSTKGKLVRLFTAFSKYNSDAESYLKTIIENRNDPDKSRLRVNFLGYHSVLKLITIMREMVLDNICDQMKKAGKYAIISDSTQDTSKKESVVLIARYVEENETNGIVTVKPVERIIGAFTTGVTTGAELSKKCLTILEERGLDKKNVIGQSYDGASNMSGSFNGMQSLIQAECPSAVYVWCHAHRFALVVEKSIENCVPLRNHFGILEELYVFMSGHRRHCVFTECLTKSQADRKNEFVHLNKRRLKRVSTTRWSSRSAANSTVHDCYDEILECLRIIENDKSMGQESVTKAAGLRKQMLTFDFVANMTICEEIFAVLSPVTNVLQGVQTDLGAATLIISNVIERLGSLRQDQDDKFRKLFKSVEETCSTFDIPTMASKRRCIRRRFHDEMGIDTDTHFDNFQNLKVNVWFVVIDQLLGALRERFTKNTLAFLNEANLLTHQKLVKDENLEPDDIGNLCRFYNLDPHRVSREANEFKKMYPVLEKNVDMSDLVKDSKEKKISKDDAVPTSSAENNETEANLDADELERNEDEDEDEEELTDSRTSNYESLWVARGFCKPFRLVSQFSTFSSLRVLLTILITLPVTSCTAERVFSKHKIIKNYLRSVMLDPYMSAMLILAAESAILETIENEKIIDRFASTSNLLTKMLIFK